MNKLPAAYKQEHMNQGCISTIIGTSDRIVNTFPALTFAGHVVVVAYDVQYLC